MTDTNQLSTKKTARNFTFTAVGGAALLALYTGFGGIFGSSLPKPSAAQLAPQHWAYGPDGSRINEPGHDSGSNGPEGFSNTWQIAVTALPMPPTGCLERVTNDPAEPRSCITTDDVLEISTEHLDDPEFWDKGGMIDLDGANTFLKFPLMKEGVMNSDEASGRVPFIVRGNEESRVLKDQRLLIAAPQQFCIDAAMSEEIDRHIPEAKRKYNNLEKEDSNHTRYFDHLVATCARKFVAKAYSKGDYRPPAWLTTRQKLGILHGDAHIPGLIWRERFPQNDIELWTDRNGYNPQADYRHDSIASARVLGSPK